jgi:hypothetical protein
MIPIQLHDLLLKDISTFEDKQSIASSVIEFATVDGGFKLPKRSRRTIKKIQINGTITRNFCDDCSLTVKEFKCKLQKLRSYGIISLFASDPVDDEIYKLNVVASDPYLIVHRSGDFDFSLTLDSTDAEWIQVDKTNLFQKKTGSLCYCLGWNKIDTIDTHTPSICLPFVDILDPFWSPPAISNETSRFVNIFTKMGFITVTNGASSTICGNGSWTATAPITMTLQSSAVDVSKYPDGTSVTPLDYLLFSLNISNISTLTDLNCRIKSVFGASNFWDFNNLQLQTTMVNNTCIEVRIPLSYAVKTGQLDLTAVNQIQFTASGTGQFTVNNFRFEKRFGVGWTPFNNSIGIQVDCNAEVQVLSIFDGLNPKVVQYGSDTFTLPVGTIAVAIYNSQVEIYSNSVRQTLKRIKTKLENGENIGISIISQDTRQSYYKVNNTQT